MDTIIRGTTPTILFTFQQTNVEDIAVAYLTIKHGDSVVLEKDLTTATIDTDSISWTLTQSETLKLAIDDIQIRLNWKLTDGTRGASKKKKIYIEANDKEVEI